MLRPLHFRFCCGPIFVLLFFFFFCSTPENLCCGNKSWMSSTRHPGFGIPNRNRISAPFFNGIGYWILITVRCVVNFLNVARLNSFVFGSFKLYFYGPRLGGGKSNSSRHTIAVCEVVNCPDVLRRRKSYVFR